ncbi:MAG TPA: ABC transporter permease [Pseudolysinimonas sp.]|jgi:ABC-2 type transport system permease protein|nr:ABC transporter permease [Pseudolysinimonas sp.]
MLGTVVRIELHKLAASLVGRVATAAVIGGVTVLSVAMLFAVRSGRPEITAKLGALTDDWAGFLSAAIQVTGAGGLLGSAVVLGWMLGREFTDREIAGLFALPVGRAQIAGAKLLAYLVWSIGVAVLLPLAVLVAGAAAGLGAPDVAGLARLGALSLGGALLATPVALAATLGRSVLAGVGVAVGLLVIAQVSVIAGAGGWMPLAAPALWAVSAGQLVSPGQLLLVPVFSGVFVVLTLVGWRRLEVGR